MGPKRWASSIAVVRLAMQAHALQADTDIMADMFVLLASKTLDWVKTKGSTEAQGQRSVLLNFYDQIPTHEQFMRVRRDHFAAKAVRSRGQQKRAKRPDRSCLEGANDLFVSGPPPLSDDDGN